MCTIDFPIWDQAVSKSLDDKVTHLLGQDYLLPATMYLTPEVFIDDIQQVSPYEIRANLVAQVQYGDEILIRVPVECRIQTPASLDERYPQPEKREACVRLLAGMKTVRHRANLRKCLSVAVRRRQVRRGRLERAVPPIIKVR